MTQTAMKTYKTDFPLSDYDFDLPAELIAQSPADRRGDSRLLILDRETGAVTHDQFRRLGEMLFPGDVLVVNDTRVIPARLHGTKATGGKVEVLLLDYAGGIHRKDRDYHFICTCLINASKGPKPGAMLHFGDLLSARVTGRKDGIYTLEFISDIGFDEVLDKIGEVPLPPYIRRDGDTAPCNDKNCYQTVYAEKNGAVAAPTAGLHFSDEHLSLLQSNGVQIARITLHVGYGTFMPVRVDDIRDHAMHSERYTISAQTAETLNRTKAEGRRIIAVGTTSVRTLEYATDASGHITPGSGACDLFIYPGYQFKTVSAMITNFHLPRSTLIMLVSAFAGRENILNAYREAIAARYRFYSYGDAMLIG